MRKLSLILFALFLINIAAICQNEKTSPSSIKKAKTVWVAPSLASKIEDGTFIAYDSVKTKQKNIEINPMRINGNQIIPGKGLPIGQDPLRIKKEDLIKNPSTEPIISWDASESTIWTPTDPSGAAGPNHYVNAWNMGYKFWDKEGNELAPAADFTNLWPGQENGDPIVIYDKFADRFLITQFYGNGFLIAVCQGSDPVNDGWYTYQFETDAFPDYPKFSVWSDGYYVTSNYNAADPASDDAVFVMERDSMLVGSTNAQFIGFPLPSITYSAWLCPLSFNCNGPELPPAGGMPIVYMQDDSWSGVTTDHLNIWTIDVDWLNPANSTISSPLELETEVFNTVFNGGLWDNIPQPTGPEFSGFSGYVMQMAQYRRFEDHNSAVINFSVNLDDANNLAGIRWYELRQDNDGDDWYIYQEGSYEQPDGHNAWCGSIAMDEQGNIGLGYSVVSAEISTSIRYTGRFSNDPLNQMTVEENTIIDGPGNSASNRYGDYAQLTMDPTDDQTFWHIAEYFKAGGDRTDIVGAFKLVPNFNVDAGIIAINEPTDGTLSDAEIITVSIRNFGLDSIWNIPVSYSVDGGTLYTENYIDTIPPTTTVQYSFIATEDFSILENVYAITAYTSYLGDEDNENDTITSLVKHLLPNDLGIVEISSPSSGSLLASNEAVTVKIQNFGGATQSDFEVSYILNSGDVVTEIVPGPFDGPGVMTYTFTETVDLSVFVEYNLIAFTSLLEDSDLENDTSFAFIENSNCTPFTNCSFGDGFQLFQLTTIDNESGCSNDGYADYSDLIAQLYPGSTNDLTVTTGYGDQFVKVWIDFNDNFVFENDELIIDDFELGNNQAEGVFTATTDFTIDANAALGEHLMRAKTNWNNGVPEDACIETTYGETEDYSVNIDLSIGLDEKQVSVNDLTIQYLSENHYLLSFTSENLADPYYITVHNVFGQNVLYNRVYEQNGTFQYDLDMSYAAAGVYLIRIGSDKYGKVKKIVVD